LLNGSPFYDLINKNIHLILDKMPRSHINDYEELVRDLGDNVNESYQGKYKAFWAMNAARLSKSFCDRYFQLLKEQIEEPKNLEEITMELYDTPCNSRGFNSLQFSFSTKLFHMADRHSPIYDRYIATFFSFIHPSTQSSVQKRLDKFMSFHRELKEEYEEVISRGILKPALDAFRERFNPSYFTDEKIIDSIIWEFASDISSLKKYLVTTN
jgi:hypothetical protein